MAGVMLTIGHVARINGMSAKGVGNTVRRLHGTRRRIKMQKLLDRDGILCLICYRPFTETSPPTIDHIIEIANGGGNNMGNLRLAHPKCNKLRSTDPKRLERLILVWYRRGLYE